MDIIQRLLIGDKIRQNHLDGMDWSDRANHHFIISAEIMALETILDQLQVNNIPISDYLESYNV